jgi:acetolactate synthase-1/3 small subunit
MRHTIAVLVKDHPGVLARVASLFTRRGFNIESLAVGHTEETDISRMTIVVKGDERVLEQITKQLNKLIDVIRVKDISPQNSVERELALIKVNTNSLPFGLKEVVRTGKIALSRGSVTTSGLKK